MAIRDHENVLDFVTTDGSLPVTRGNPATKLEELHLPGLEFIPSDDDDSKGLFALKDGLVAQMLLPSN